jgi:tetratricopeptide (TPR) repeat protein
MKSKRRMEATTWFLSATQLGHKDAVAKIAELYIEDPQIASVLPSEYRKQINVAEQATAAAQSASIVGLLGAASGQRPFVTAAVIIPGNLSVSEKQRIKFFPANFSKAWQTHIEAEKAERNRQQIAQLQESAQKYHDLAEAYESKGRQQDYLRALQKEFDVVSELKRLKVSLTITSESFMADLAAKIARIYVNTNEAESAVSWMTRAAELHHPESLFHLAEWYSNGTFVKIDLKKASRYNYLARYYRGKHLLESARYEFALPDLKNVAESEQADTEDIQNLGRCYIKLKRWDEAIRASARVIEFDSEAERIPDIILDAFEKLIVAERPDELLKLIELIEKKGWTLEKARQENRQIIRNGIMFYGFQSIALHMTGKDAFKTERSMWQSIEKSRPFRGDWSTNGFFEWVKSTKLAPDRKTAVEEIVAQMTWDEERLKVLAKEYQNRADMFKSTGQSDAYRKALEKEFFILVQLGKLDDDLPIASNKNLIVVATKIAQFFVDTKEANLAVQWTTRAAELGHAESHLQLADWYQTGTFVVVDRVKANRHHYLGYHTRGMNAYRRGRYNDALPDLQKVCESANAVADDFETLGLCYCKLYRWDEAIKAYNRGIDLDLNRPGIVLDLIEAHIAAERPSQLFEVIEALEKRGWKLPTAGSRESEYTALYHGFRAIALHMIGKDASAAERAMREITGKKDYESNWGWNELNQWLKTTKLPPERKTVIVKIIDELKGTKGND